MISVLATFLRRSLPPLMVHPPPVSIRPMPPTNESPHTTMATITCATYCPAGRSNPLGASRGIPRSAAASLQQLRADIYPQILPKNVLFLFSRRKRAQVGTMRPMNSKPRHPQHLAPEMSRPLTDGQTRGVRAGERKARSWGVFWQIARTRIDGVCNWLAQGTLPKGIRSHFPGTAQHTRRYQKRIVEAARKRRQRLLVLCELEVGDNKVVRTRLRHFQNQLAAVGVWDDAIARVSSIVILLFAAILFPTLDLPAIKNTPSDLSLKVKVGVGIALVALFFLLIWVSAFISRIQRTHEYLRSIGFWVHILLMGIFGWLGVIVFPIRADELWRDILPALKLVGFLLLPIVVVGVTLGLLFRRRLSTICTDAVVSDKLLQMLTVLRSPCDWRDLAKRSQLFKPLEEAATCVEFGLPRRLRSGDPVSDLWLQQRAIHIAAALRELKQWIGMPKEDTRAILVDRVKADLVSIATGNWDRLAGADPKNLAMRVWVAVWARDGVVAFLPLTALWFLHRWTPTVVEPPMLTWLFPACFVWLVYRLSAIFDPRLSVDTFRSFLDLLSWLKPKE